MLSDEQQLIRDNNILKVAIDFYENGGTINDVANRTGFTKSTVQRYLTSERLAYLLEENNSNKNLLTTVAKEIKEQLIINKEEGNYKGGYISSRNNEAIKNPITGHFEGIKKR